VLGDHAGKMTSEFANVRIRLYGGWTDDQTGTRTEAADMVAQVLYRHGQTRQRHVRIKSELALALLEVPDAPLHRTFRRSPWRGDRLTFSGRPENCAEPGPGCRYYDDLREWSTRGRCPRRPGCHATTNTCVTQEGQKLVDAMIVADAISGCLQKNLVVVVSRDDDVVPGVLTAAKYGRVALFRIGRRNLPGDYDALIRREGIELHDQPNVP
jgi:hypothetical protein